MLRTSTWFLFVSLATGLGACSGNSESTGSSGNGAGTYDDLKLCAAPPTCSATASFDDGGGELSLHNFSCLMNVLRDRTPGTYTLERSSEDGGGSGSHTDILVIGDDGAVTHASHHRVQSYTSDPPTDIDESTPVQRCELKPNGYFQSCLDAINADPQGQTASDCAQVYADWRGVPLPYFTSCKPEAYECAPTDRQRLAACASPDIDAHPPVDTQDTPGITAVRSLLEALRDRTPGQFQYRTTRDITYHWGHESRVFISQSDPNYVLTAADGVNQGEFESTPYSTQAERCKLQPASYFQACIDSLGTSAFGSNDPECLHYGTTALYPWFETCEAAEPVCQ